MIEYEMECLSAAGNVFTFIVGLLYYDFDRQNGTNLTNTILYDET